MTSHDTQTTASSARELGEQQALRWLTTYYKVVQRAVWFRELDQRFFWDISYPEWFRRTLSLTTTTHFLVGGIGACILMLIALFRWFLPLFWWLASRPAHLIHTFILDWQGVRPGMEFIDLLFAILVLTGVVYIVAHFLDSKARRNLRVLVETTWYLANDGWVRDHWSALSATFPTPGVLKYCPNCSLGLPAKAKFCYECGYNQDQPAPAQRSYFTDVRNEN